MKIIKPENIFFQGHKRPDKQKYSDDFSELQGIYSSIKNSQPVIMTNIFDPRNPVESYNKNLAIFSGVNLGNKSVTDVAEKMNGVLNSLREAMENQIEEAGISIDPNEDNYSKDIHDCVL